MRTHVLDLRHHGEIGWIVVQMVSVDVVNDLASLKRAPYVLLDHHAVLVATVAFAIRAPVTSAT